MAKIYFVDHSGETRTIDVENGATVMEAAIRSGDDPAAALAELNDAVAQARTAIDAILRRC